MSTLKKLFPYSFQSLKKLSDLIINILIQLLIGALAGVLIVFFMVIPEIKELFKEIRELLEI